MNTLKINVQRRFCLYGLLAVFATSAGCWRDKPANNSSVQVTTPTAPPPPAVPPQPLAVADTETIAQAPSEPKQTTKPMKLPPGIVAYATKTTAILYAKPSQKAPKLPIKFKQSETIYILETQMTDEEGREFEVPQWYKIQCTNGQQGWMPARFVGQPF